MTTRSFLWIAVAGALLLLAHVALFLPFTVDDAYIFFRYAGNVADGLGPVYNPGEPVEGYTSPAWLVILAVTVRLGISPIVAAKGIGVGCGLVALLVMYGAACRLRGRPLRALPALVLVAGNPLYAVWIGSGMDTALFALVVSGFCAIAIGAARAPDRAGRYFALLLALSILVRPEGGLLLVVAVVFAPLIGLAHWRSRIVAAFVAAAVPLELYRWVTFGAFLPNTFHAKVHPSGGALAAGIENVAIFAFGLGPLLILAALGAIRGSRSERFIGLLVVVHLAYVVAVGGDVLLQRIHVPILIPVALLIEGGLLQVFDLLRRRGSVLVRGPGGVAFGVSLVLMYLTTAAFEDWSALRRDIEQFRVSYVVLNSRNVDQVLRPLGEWLRERAPATTAAAVDDIGGVGYYSGVRIIDLYGLVDPVIARLRHRPGAVADEVFRRRPEWLLLRAGYYHLQGYDITDDPRFERYELVRTFRRGSYGITVFRRRAAGGEEPPAAEGGRG